MSSDQWKTLAYQLESNADAHQEPQGTERRRAAAALQEAAQTVESVGRLVAQAQEVVAHIKYTAPHANECAVSLAQYYGDAPRKDCNCWKASL